jgi:hypothetical protein
MRRTSLIASVIACAAVVSVPVANADPAPDQVANVRTPSPPMRCAVASGNREGEGPTVVCQTGGFPQAPMHPMPYPGWKGDPSVLHDNQAIVNDSGQLSWRTANLGLAPPGRPDIVLVADQSYHLQGWTILPTSDGVTFTSDETGHGMAIGSDYSVRPF